MATTISTQDIVEAKRDIEDIGEAVNEVKVVSPRYGEDFKSLPMIAAEAQATIGEWESAISLITQEDGIPALAVSDASGVTQQELNDDLIAFKDRSRLFCNLGAIPNDASKSAHNAEIFLREITNGVIDFDDYYYVDASSTNIIDNSVHLVSSNKAGTLHLTGNVSNFLKFNSVDHLIIEEGLTITTTETSGSICTLNDDLAVFNKISIKANIKTKCRLINFIFSTTSDPSVNFYGCREVDFRGVNLTDTHSTFTLMNCPCPEFNISGARIRNMSFVPFYFGIDNAHAYTSNVRSMQQLVADGVDTLNADDFWATEGSGVYLAVCVFEGNKATIKNSKTEGLKCKDYKSLYDFYLSCTEVEYDNNLWKNNICFNSTKQNADLMKAKGAVESRYRNSTFIVEEDFVLRHATDVASQGWVNLGTRVEGTNDSNLIMRNNTIDVFMLLGMSSSGETKNIDMQGNTYKIKVFASVFLNFKNYHNTSDADFSDASIVFKDKIHIESIGRIVRNGTEYGASGISSIIKMAYDDTKPTYKLIDIANEVYIGQTAVQVYYAGDVGGVYAQQITVNESVKYGSDPDLRFRMLVNVNFVSTVHPANIKFNIYTTTTPISGGLTAAGLNLDTGGTFELNMSYPYVAYTVSLPPLEATRKTVTVEQEFTQSGLMRSSMFRVDMQATDFKYKDAAGVSQTVTYPATWTNYVPQSIPIRAIDEVAAAQFSTILDGTKGQMRIRNSFTGLTNNVRTQMHFKVSVA